MAIEQESTQIYQDLFVQRRDVYARQTRHGAYFLNREPVTPEILRAHLEGKITAGWYALSRDNTVRWIALDADRADGLDQLQDAWKQLAAQGIPSYLEASRRGAHLWIFVDPIAAATARRLILTALPDLAGVEVFPKQTELAAANRVGSLVRGPLGIHLLTGRRYPFLDPISLQPISRSVIGTLGYLQDVERLDADQVWERLPATPPPDHSPILLYRRDVPPHPDRGRSPIERLKEQIGDPYAFIAQFVELDARGRGHCPLHPPDHHVSFAVDRQTGQWRCFHEVDLKTGRYLGGDAIEFYRRLKGLSFKEVITELAQLYP